jgi:hypothetical protein
MERHNNTVPNKTKSKVYEFGAPRCSRKSSNGFTRKDHLTEHLQNYHHRKIPKHKKGNSVEKYWQPSDEDREKGESDENDEGYSGEYQLGALCLSEYPPQYQSF